MRIEITSQKRNDLLNREEVVFEILHEKAGTPPRLKVREMVAGALKVDLERVYIKRLETKTGSMVTVGEANIYDSVEDAMRVEPKHIILRNKPKEKGGEGE